MLSWFMRWKYVQQVKSCRKIQKWWRRVSVERSWYMTRVEASLCIQSAWKRRITRKWFEQEWLRQEKYIADLEATICIQAAWRGRRQRSKSVRSSGNTPRYNDDSAIEALLYDLVAMVEVGVEFPSVSNASAWNETVPGPLVLDDSPVSNEEKEADVQVLGVVNDLVEAVIGTEGFAERTDDIKLPLDVSSGDQSCQDREIVFEQKTNLETRDPNCSGTVVMTDDNVVGDAPADNESPDEECVSVIRNLLEELVEKTNQDTGPQAVNETEVAGSDALLVTSADEEINNSKQEVDENENVIQPNATEEARHDTNIDNFSLDHGEVATTVSKLPQQPVGTELSDIFDTEAADGDLLIPNASDSDEANSDNEEARGSSIDSTDLMMEADAMAILQGSPDNERLSVVTSPPPHRRTTRLDSLILLEDVDKLEKK
ncbi:hypothetical protein DVH05_003078 [Phytophthora capsici]|nr:hypothetical protein DVH05_003078 [Phytophthora capsici]